MYFNVLVQTGMIQDMCQQIIWNLKAALIDFFFFFFCHYCIGKTLLSYEIVNDDHHHMQQHFFFHWIPFCLHWIN